MHAARSPLPTASLDAAPPLSGLCGRLRVTGQLTDDARLELDAARGAGASWPRMLLRLQFCPPALPGVPECLPYTALVDLGTDPTDHLQAELLAPQLRTGALVSVAAQGLQPRTDHGHFVLRLVQPSAVLLLEPPPPATPRARPSSSTSEASS